MTVTDDNDIAVVELTPDVREAIITALGGYAEATMNLERGF